MHLCCKGAPTIPLPSSFVIGRPHDIRVEGEMESKMKQAWTFRETWIDKLATTCAWKVPCWPLTLAQTKAHSVFAPGGGDGCCFCFLPSTEIYLQWFTWALHYKKKKSLGWGVAFKGHHVTGRLAGAVEVTDSVEFLLRPKNWGQRDTARERTRRGPGKHNHARKQNRKMTARTGRSEGKQARRWGCESARTFSFEDNLAAHIKSLCILVLKFHVQALPFRHSQWCEQDIVARKFTSAYFY